MDVQGQALVSAPGVADNAVCNACKRSLDDAQDEAVVSFGKYLFHVDCRCAKCHSLVEHNTNLLLLSDGSPVCENCSYMCTICQKPIHNEAIVTGDESYHADCFRCRSCSNKIEELIFAKTNQGIWCMSCHNDRVARTRRHAEAKRKGRKDRDPKSRWTSQGREDRDRTQQVGNEPTITLTDETSSSAPPRSPDLVPHPVSRSPASPTGPSGRSRDGLAGDVLRPPGGEAPSPRTVSDPVQPSHEALKGQEPEARLDPRSTPSDRYFRHEPVARDPAEVSADGSTRSERAGQSDDQSGGSLAAPSGNSKAKNRRSGFYGAMSRPIPPREDSISPHDRRASMMASIPPAGSPRRSSHDFATPPRSSSRASPPPEPPQKDAPGEMQSSASFYDPDTLLFLDQVNRTSPSPQAKEHSEHAFGTFGSAQGQASDEERLDPLALDARAASVDVAKRGEVAAASPAGSETARRVRESLQLSRGESLRSSLAELDVELVEQLLGELETTQREIKDIKTRYNAFRRASQTAFEGFSMAREEYDKEVAARREVERQMASLRARFADQARRLAQVDQDQQTADDLKRQSTSLRTSVVGMEKQLSQLRAEVALSTAQVAQLASLDPAGNAEEEPADRHSLASSSHADVADALNTRLETVKDAHRAEIGALVVERDELRREIDELRKVRDAHNEEIAELESRQATLSRRNETAARDLGGLQESFSRMTTASARSEQIGSGHVPTPSASSASTALSPIASRTLLPATRQGSLPQDGELTARPAVVETASRTKFWGKSRAKPDSSKQAQNNLASPNLNDRNVGASLRGSASPDSHLRPHYFQQTSILRPVRCDYCGDKMWGLNEVRCQGCGSYAHAKCSSYLPPTCSTGGPSTLAAPPDDSTPAAPAGPSMFGAELALQAEKEGTAVPVVVTRCIEAVEAGGMLYEGIYRKTGGMGQTKLIGQLFDRGQEFDLCDGDTFNDIAAVTSCLKNYFRSLPNPLMTHELHEDFMAATEIPEGDGRLDAIERTLLRLPAAHYETAKYLFLHLSRVKTFAAENKMTAANLGVVFGPTVLRSPVAAREWSDMGPKTKLVEILCDHAERLFSGTSVEA